MQNSKFPYRVNKIQNYRSKLKSYLSVDRGFKICILVLSLSFVLCVLSFVSVKTAYAQTFSLIPSTATKSADLEFTVDLNIDTGGKKVTAADVKMTFDPAILQVTKILDGTFFTATSHNIYTGTLYVGGSFSDETQTTTGSGKLATLTLKGKTVGTSQLAFVCTTQTTDTNILDDSAIPKDIVNCAATKDGNYTITGTATGSAGLGGGTAIPTPVPPVTGISLPTIMAFGFGAFLIVMGLVFIF